mgnify:CR=1 FL=1
MCCSSFFFQAEDGIRDLVRSRGLGDVYKRQELDPTLLETNAGVLLLGPERKSGEIAFHGHPQVLSLIHI